MNMPVGREEYAAQRGHMVDTQIVARGIRDPWGLQAMRTVPREAFVPASLRDSAYDDGPLPIGEGQTISQPYVVAAMTEAVQPRPGDRALEIGTGSAINWPSGGRLVMPIGSTPRFQRLVRVTRLASDDYAREDLEAVTFVPLIGQQGWPDGQEAFE